MALSQERQLVIPLGIHTVAENTLAMIFHMLLEVMDSKDILDNNHQMLPTSHTKMMVLVMYSLRLLTPNMVIFREKLKVMIAGILMEERNTLPTISPGLLLLCATTDT